MEDALTVQHKNCFGEAMELKMDRQGKLWFKHEDCNSEFEDMSKLNIIYNIGGKSIKGFKYILSDDEKIVINNFLSMSTELAPKVKEYHWKSSRDEK